MDTPLNTPGEQRKESIRQEVFVQTVTLLLNGLSLVAALAWNDAIISLFKKIFPETNGGLIAKFVYAAVVTMIIVIFSMRLRKLKELQEKNNPPR